MEKNYKAPFELCLDIHKQNIILEYEEIIEANEKRIKNLTQPNKDLEIALRISSLVMKHIIRTIEDLELPAWINEDTLSEIMEKKSK